MFVHRFRSLLTTLLALLALCAPPRDVGAQNLTVTAATDSLSVGEDSGPYNLTFSIEYLGNDASVTFDLSCHNTIGSCDDSDIDPSYTLVLGSSNRTANITAVWYPGGVPANGVVRLWAIGEDSGGPLSAKDSVVVETLGWPQASVTASSASATIDVPAVAPAVDTVWFSVADIGTASGLFQLTTECTEAFDCVLIGADTMTLAANDTVLVGVYFDAVPTGGFVKLQASVTVGLQSAGYDYDTSNLTIREIASPTVVTDAAAHTFTNPNDSLLIDFQVTNENAALARAYNLTCASSATWCHVLSPGLPATIQGGDTIDVWVSVKPGSAGNHSATLTATDASLPQATDAATAAVQYSPLWPSVSFAAPKSTANPSAQVSRTFTVNYVGGDWVTLTTTCSAGLSNCSSPGSVNLTSVTSLEAQVTFMAPANARWDTISVVATAGTKSDTAFHFVQTLPSNGLLLTLDDSIGAVTERLKSECLTVSAGAGGVSCDDYQVAYPLMPIGRMNRARGATLIYNSSTPYPRGVLGGTTTVPDSGQAPTRVFARLRLGSVVVDSINYDSTAFLDGQTSRVAFDLERYSHQGSGLLSFAVDAKAWFGSDTLPTVTKEGTVMLVDRREAFGRGWWLSGYESLVSVGNDTLVWLGGDGSGRIYERASASTFIAQTRGRPDTITTSGGGSSSDPGYIDLAGNEGGHVAAGEYSGLTGVDKMTWAFWINPSGEGRLAGIMGGSTSTWSWWMDAARTYGDAIWWGAYNTATSASVVVESAGLNYGSWNFVVVQYDGTQATNSNRLRIHINGQDRTTYFNYTTVPTQLRNVSQQFGVGLVSSSWAGLPGLLGEFATIQGVLPDSVKTDWYNNGIDFSAAGLVAGYRWQGSLADESSEGNSLTADNIDSSDYGTTTSYPTRATSSSGAYVRHLLGGGQVNYDAAGRHIATIDRNGNETRFNHDTIPGTIKTRLTSIALPTPSGPQTAYRFHYHDASGTVLLDSISVLGGDGGFLAYAMGDSITGSGDGFELRSITAPDGLATSFAYNGSGNGILTSLTDHRGAETQVFYTHQKVDSVRLVTSDPNQTAVWHYSAYSTLGVDSAGPRAPVVVDETSALLDGPRTEVSDTTRFYVTTWGAVRGVRDALGHETWIERNDANHSGLVTEVVYPNGRVDAASYSPTTGLVDSTKVFAEDTAVVRYQWDAGLSRTTQITSAEGVVTRMRYDTLGNRLMQAVGPDSVHFVYDSLGLGLLTSIQSPEGRVTTLGYDVYGNLNAQTSPLGFVSTFQNDTVGRVLVAQSPTATSSAVIVETNTYDDMGRLLRHITTNSLDGAFAWDSTGYNAEGDRWKVSRTSEPSSVAVDSMGFVSTPAEAAYDPIIWEYDDLGRVKTETRDEVAETRHYDLAGNLVQVDTRAGTTVLMQYDTLNRLKTKTTGSRVYAASDSIQGAYNSTYWEFPKHPNSGTSLVVSGDTASFAYDVMGNVTQATNRDAVVSRSYTLRGQVETETQDIDSPLTGSVVSYEVGYVYDADDRIKEIHYPGHAVGSPKEATYVYDSGTGRLGHVENMMGVTTSFQYDQDGYDTLIAHPGQDEVRRFDDDGRLTYRQVGLFTDSIVVDRGGRILDVIQDPGTNLYLDVTNKYDGLGHPVLAIDSLRGVGNAERFVLDGLGNILAKRVLRTYGTDPYLGVEYNTYVLPGRLVSRTVEADSAHGVYCNMCDGPYPQGMEWTYEEDGSVSTVGGFVQQTTYPSSAADVSTSAEKNYYDAEARLRFRQKHTLYYATLGIDKEIGAWEEYRYDALGRRVAVLTKSDDLCTDPSVCYSAERFYVWGGDQLLSEESRRVPGGDTLTVTSQYGTVHYTHAGGLDQPVDVVRDTDVLIPHVNWRGQWVAAADTTGAACCTDADWPGDRRLAFNNAAPTSPPTVGTWYGSLLSDQQDVTGLLYRRNRYYDPQTGQFTQEDPIGFAGGLNLYGYANGDPINYSDPFGLCPWCIGAVVGFAVEGTAQLITGRFDRVALGTATVLGGLSGGLSVASGVRTAFRYAGQGAIGAAAGLAQAEGDYTFSEAAFNAALGVGGEFAGELVGAVNAANVKGYIQKTIAGLESGSLSVIAEGSSRASLIGRLTQALEDKRSLESFLSGLAVGLAGLDEGRR